MNETKRGVFILCYEFPKVKRNEQRLKQRNSLFAWIVYLPIFSCKRSCFVECLPHSLQQHMFIKLSVTNRQSATKCLEIGICILVVVNFKHCASFELLLQLHDKNQLIVEEENKFKLA